MKPKIEKKFKSRVPIKVCESCVHRKGDFFQDIENEDITRVYCTARYTNVNTAEMEKYCDFHSLKIITDD